MTHKDNSKKKIKNNKSKQKMRTRRMNVGRSDGSVLKRKEKYTENAKTEKERRSVGRFGSDGSVGPNRSDGSVSDGR